MQERGRQAGFERNEVLEDFLPGLNALLAPANQALLDEPPTERSHPVVFVMGAPRSGTTLFMQWLATTGICACPGNLLARFYRAPLIGARIQRLLTDPALSFRDELADLQVPANFESANGKTRGALAPNEFWYFWRRFGFDPDNRYTPDDVLRPLLRDSNFQAELCGLSREFEKPFALKAMIANHNIAVLNELFDQSLFVWLRRSPAYNIQSLLEARVRQYGDSGRWYSFEVPEIKHLRGLTPLQSAAAQIQAVNRDIAAALALVDEGRQLQVNYETFCERPAATFAALGEKLQGMGEAARPDYEGPDAFAARKSWRLAKTSEADAREAYAEMERKEAYD